jgi:hypothetical protein
MAPTIWQEDDLLIQSHSGQHDPCLHAYCSIEGMVARGGGSNGKCLDYASLKLKMVAECEDLNINWLMSWSFV